MNKITYRNELKITKIRLKINENLFKNFNEYNSMCVKEDCVHTDNNLCEKYTKLCIEKSKDDPKRTISCDECWKKFLTEDLIIIEEDKIL
jgi:hypothetical protein